MSRQTNWNVITGLAAAAGAVVLACVLALAVPPAVAQEAAKDTPKAAATPQEGLKKDSGVSQKESAVPPTQARPGFFGSIGRWVDQTTSSFNDNARYLRERFLNLGRDAGEAAKTTVDNARDAADAVGRLPNSRMIAGHEKCEIAPNGAPDCIAAAFSICKAKGFDSGKSLDMTTAEVCPPQVYLNGRNSGAECHTETFVSRALCQ
jgi:hypothetical protein